MVLVLVGFVLGPIVDDGHRAVLGLYFVALGAAFSWAVHELSRDEEGLRKAVESRARWRPFKDRQPEHIERETDRQQSLLRWIGQPFAVLLAVAGLVLLAQSLGGP